MKIEQNIQEAQITGDVQSNKVSIDSANIDFIITILSTNLYSKPIESFIRETVSNAWDSHVEAGVDKPVILELGTNTEGKHYCKIQDFGVGISPERFDKIYRNIGSSTKRNDNTQIGGFGIGRFSALAYSNMVTITSIYQGTEYKYLMYKNGNSISIDLVYQQTTNNPNGVSVEVPIKNDGDVRNFYNAAISQLSFFENLYFETSFLDDSVLSKEAISSFNNSRVKKYNNFLVTNTKTNYNSNSNTKIRLLLGKVAYPLRLENISLPNYNSEISQLPIAINFEIGDIEVTPNREEILYTDKTKQLIKHKLSNAIAEINQLYSIAVNRDFDSLTEYVESLSKTFQLELLPEDKYNSAVHYSMRNNGNSSTFKGDRFDSKNFKAIYDTIMTISLLPISYKVVNGKINSITDKDYNRTLSISTIKQNFNNIYITKWAELDNYSRSYIRENFSDGSIFIHPVSIKKYIRRYYSELKNRTSSNYYRYTMDFKIIKTILRELLPNLLKIKKFSNLSVPVSYINQKKADAKAKRAMSTSNIVNWKENINFYVLRLSDRGYNKVTFSTELKSLEVLNQTHKLTIYSDRNNEMNRALFSLLNHFTNIEFIEVAPTKLKLLKELHNFIHIDDFIKTPKIKIMRDLATAKLLKEKYGYILELNKINNLSVISTELYSVVSTIADFIEKYTKKFPQNYESKDNRHTLIDEIFDICETNNYYNFKILGLVKENEKMLENSKFLLNFRGKSYPDSMKIPNEQIDRLVDYIVARRLFTPNKEVFLKFKYPERYTEPEPIVQP